MKRWIFLILGTVVLGQRPDDADDEGNGVSLGEPVFEGEPPARQRPELQPRQDQPPPRREQEPQQRSQQQPESPSTSPNGNQPNGNVGSSGSSSTSIEGPRPVDGTSNVSNDNGDNNNNTNNGDNNKGGQGDGDKKKPVTEEDVDELLNDVIDDFSNKTPEEREAALRDFAESEDFNIDFGFNDTKTECSRKVPEGDQSCPNYVGLLTAAEEDDIEALLALIEVTCGSENTTPPNALGPFLCLGAVGSCKAPEFGWELPSNSTKGSIGAFFNKVSLGSMTDFGEDNNRNTLCYKDCRAAWEYWADCGSFDLDKQRDPCEGLPSSGCYDPSRIETATAGANAVTIASGMMVAWLGWIFMS